MTDREIIARIIDNGEQDLFGVIVRRHSGAVYVAALAVAHDKDVAEEAVQQAFVKAYENIERWRGGVSIAPYLKMIAHNTALTLLTERARRRSTPLRMFRLHKRSSRLPTRRGSKHSRQPSRNSRSRNDRLWNYSIGNTCIQPRLLLKWD